MPEVKTVACGICGKEFTGEYAHNMVGGHKRTHRIEEKFKSLDLSSPEFSYILGVLATDGFYCDNRIALEAKQEKFVERFRQNVEDFGLKTHTETRERAGEINGNQFETKLIRCQAFCLPLVNYLKEMSHDEIYDLAEHKNKFLAGVYDGDGSYTSYGDIQISHQKDRDFRTHIELALDELGINYSPRKGKIYIRRESHERLISVTRPAVRSVPYNQQVE